MKFWSLSLLLMIMSCSYAPPPTVALSDLHRGLNGDRGGVLLMSARASTSARLDSAEYRGSTGKQLTLSGFLGLSEGSFVIFGGASNLNPIIAGSYFLTPRITITPYLVPNRKNLWGGTNLDVQVERNWTISGSVSREQFWGTTEYEDTTSGDYHNSEPSMLGLFSLLPDDQSLGNYWCYRLSVAFHFDWGPEKSKRAFALQQSAGFIESRNNRKYDTQLQIGHHLQ
jgi:hypothetical protein